MQLHATVETNGYRGIRVVIGLVDNERWTDEAGNPKRGFGFSQTSEVSVRPAYGDEWETTVSFSSTSMDATFAVKRAAIFSAAADLANAIDGFINDDNIGRIAFDAVSKDAQTGVLYGYAQQLLEDENIVIEDELI